MADVNFYKADGSATTLDVIVDDFKANVKFTTDDLANSEYIQLDDFYRGDGSIASMIVITLFASLGGKLDNDNRLPVNIGFQNFVDAMVTPRESGPVTIESLKYTNTISFKNAESLKTKFKLISGELPPGLEFLDEVDGQKFNIAGSVPDSVDVFDINWSINSNIEHSFIQGTNFTTKVEFLDIQPTIEFSVGDGLTTQFRSSSIIESIDTYVEDDITKTKISVPFVTGTEENPLILNYAKNQIYDERGFLTQNKDPDFLGDFSVATGNYTYKDTKLVSDTTSIQDQIYKDFNFVIGMYNGDTDSLLVQESFSVRVHQNFDAVRDEFLRVQGHSGIKRYFPYLDTISSFKLPLLRADGTSTFILLENNKLDFDDQEIESLNGLLSLILEDGLLSNITLQPI